ncbi:tyrosine-protein phosphatase [Xanthomonas sp. AmX2]|uniref:tyrosine-protein phosphatase n=1 Tax=Xanthomonas sp. TaxID=29446 RepID=UPI0019801AA0|nr:tyrosine-protein phosphatase [Xanthomonas sp.]MBN6149275.1 tyrosine-protein phosphatase [Xanthomonas sp.]
MKNRKPLLALAIAALAFDAQAQLPTDIAVERVSPTRIAVVWTGALAAGEKLDLVLGDAQGKVPGNARRIDDAPGTLGRVELEHAAGTRPYVLVDDNQGHQEVVAERVLSLEGGVNFRDLGGYRTTDGRSVKWGRLYRSGVMSDLTDADYAYLQKLGIKTICDLRSQEERKVEPTDAQRIANGGNYYSLDYTLDFDAGGFAKAFSTPSANPEMTALRVFGSFYRTMPKMYAAQFRQAFADLQQGNGLLFNCSAGKDRTGVLGALVLTALGVAPDTVSADYALSALVYPKQEAARQAKHAASKAKGEPKADGPHSATMEAMGKLPPEARKVLSGTDASLIAAAFDQIRNDYGSLDAYFEKELGVSREDRKRLQEIYLEPAPRVAASKRAAVR